MRTVSGVGCAFGTDLAFMTENDRQQIRDFNRFLALPEDERGRKIVDWRWLAYANGEMGAPPKLWEGDYS